MARNKRYEKNLEKIQSYVDGTHKGKIQVGQHVAKNVHSGKKVGDKWTDSDGIEWEQKDGYRSKISKTSVGIFDKVCKDCETPCLKKFDKDTHIRMGRCYNCQVQFEEDLKWDKKNRIGKNGNKWQFWVKLQQLKRWESIDRDTEQIIFDNHKIKQSNPYDMSVANAMSNANISMEIKKNTQ